MAGTDRRLRPVLGLVAALLITVGWAATPTPADAALSTWRGGINLYRTGVFSTQRSWLWCTAAGVQIMRNIKYHRADHSRSNQSLYFDYMRARNRYSLPLSAGVDPQGWTAGLQRFVDVRYRLVAADSFMGALRLAVTRMRKLNLPVALTVAHGNHGWVLHGFTATADPAKTSSYTITSVRVSGPLWGLQNSSFGYDMRPNTKLTVTQLKRFFTKWWYAPRRMIWDNKYVSIQPLPTTTTTSTAPAPAAAPVQPVSPAPSVQPTAPIPSTVAVPPPKVAIAPAATTEPPAAAPQTLPVADLVLVLVSGGLAVIVVLLVSRIGRSGSPGRGLRDRRAGWSS
ncbi:MAG TPA: hypothetical protein VHK05_00620 [Candidatus Limnocylindrales bacterium]|jgi:hypothetical protein|nr:hypothetical protein [Candidatus Limnocylindrales bacterium]